MMTRCEAGPLIFETLSGRKPPWSKARAWMTRRAFSRSARIGSSARRSEPYRLRGMFRSVRRTMRHAGSKLKKRLQASFVRSSTVGASALSARGTVMGRDALTG